MKNSLLFLMMIAQISLWINCFDAIPQNAVIPIAGDENWDEQFGLSGMNTEVNCFVKKDGILYAGGEFVKAGGNDINRIARWDGISWSPVGVGFDENAVFSLAFYNSELYAGGIFYHSNGQTMKHIAKWNGTEWVQPGSVIDLGVYSMTPSEHGLYLGGGMISTAGIELNGIARWDGSQYYSLAGGLWLPYGETPNANTMQILGNDLYVGGEFTKAGGIDALNIARWDGSSWSPIGGGINCDGCIVTSLAFIGNDLYVAGGFSVAGGVSANNIAKWDGTQWSPLGSGTNAAVSSLAVIGDKLYAGGLFSDAGGIDAQRIAMWDGSQWWPLGSGMNNWVKTLYADGNILYAGGRFTKAGNKTAKYIARWQAALSVEDQKPDSDVFKLRNFPNPFSGSTVIKYYLKEKESIRLTINDVTSRKVSILVDEIQLPGEHQVTFYAYALPAGVYFCQLQVNGIVETNKMIAYKR